jgi:hypothetical protein
LGCYTVHENIGELKFGEGVKQKPVKLYFCK